MKNTDLIFMLALVGLSACGGDRQPQSPPKPATCTERIIATDDSLGAVRNHACETTSLAVAIRNYAEGLQQLDFQNCPPAFTAAFKSHRQAWLNLIPLVEMHPNLRGEMHVLFEELEKSEHAAEFKPLLKAVWDTWGEVEAAME